jgi:hypothetical protein
MRVLTLLILLLTTLVMSCDVNCVSCTSSNQCQECAQDYVLYNDELCLVDCPIGYSQTGHKCKTEGKSDLVVYLDFESAKQIKQTFKDD